MTWERRQHPDLLADLDILLADLRDEWNFEAGLTAKDFIQGARPLTSKQFTDKLLEAEGMTPAKEQNWVRRVKRKFVQRYGHEVSVKTYQI